MKLNRSTITSLAAATVVAASATSAFGALSSSQELSLVRDLVPYATQPATSVAWVEEVSQMGTELAGARLGTATIPTNYYFWLNDAGDVYAMTSVGDAWRTLVASAAVTADLSATTTINLFETKRNGSTINPASVDSYLLTLTLTRTSGTLTATQLRNFLRGCTTTALTTITGTGTTLASTSALPAGWVATAVLKQDTDGSSGPTAAAAVSGSLNPTDIVATFPVTTAGGVALSYNAGMRLFEFNLAVASTTKLFERFVGQTAGFASSTFDVSFRPGLMATRTAAFGGPSAGVLAALNALSTRAISTDTGHIGLYTAGTGISSRFTSVLGSSSNAMSLLTGSCIENPLTKYLPTGSMPTATVTTGYKLVAIGGDITSVTWSVDDRRLIASGVNDSGVAKNYVCDLSSLAAATMDTATNPVLKFAADDDAAFYLKTFNANGNANAIDYSAQAGINDEAKLALMAGRLYYILTDGANANAGTVSTVTGMTIPAIMAALP